MKEKKKMFKVSEAGSQPAHLFFWQKFAKNLSSLNYLTLIVGRPRSLELGHQGFLYLPPSR